MLIVEHTLLDQNDPVLQAKLCGELSCDPALCGYCALAAAISCVEEGCELSLADLARSVAIEVLAQRRPRTVDDDGALDLLSLARSAVIDQSSSSRQSTVHPIVTEVDVSRLLTRRASRRIHFMRAVHVGPLDPATLRRGFAESDYVDADELAFVRRERPFRARNESFFFETYGEAAAAPTLRRGARWAELVLPIMLCGSAPSIAVVCNFGGHFATVRVGASARTGELEVTIINSQPSWSCVANPQGHVAELVRLLSTAGSTAGGRPLAAL